MADANINLNRLRYFNAVVNAGSITDAAGRLGVTKAVVSMHIQRLEEEVGAVLLLRTTRRLSLTSAGERLAASCRTIMAEMDDVLQVIEEESRDVIGPLRVTSSIDYGARIVSPVLTALSLAHPGLQPELIATDQILDPVEEKIDVAIRLGWLRDTTQYAAKLGEFRQILVGSVAWSQKLSSVNAPGDLDGWPLVRLSILGNSDHWDFLGLDGVGHRARFKSRLSMSTTSAVRTAVYAGGGLAILPDYLVSDDIKRGDLLCVLPDWKLPTGGIFAVTHNVKLRQRRIQVFLDAMRTRIRTGD